MEEFINNKIMPVVMKFTNSRIITALKNGMIGTIPFIITGSLFLILSELPVKSWANWMNSTGLVPYFTQAYNFSFGVIALIAVIGIAYNWAVAERITPAPAGLTGLISFLIVLQPSNKIVSPDGNTILSSTRKLTGWIDTGFLGGKGMVGAILVGLITGWIFSWFVKHHITIKMPEQVPANVASSFVALIPVAVLITFWTLVYMFFDHFFHEGLLQWIYSVLQVPLQGVTDSFLGVLIVSLAVSLLWFFGVHGSTIVTGIMTAILLSNNADNAAILKAGKALTVANGAHIFTQAMLDEFITVTGSGVTFGLVIYTLFFAKSVQLKSLGKLEVIPAIFNINEPFLFGIPIVMNIMTLIPFMIAPAAVGCLTYLAIKYGIVPPFNGLYIPWTTPPIFSGFLLSGWKMAIWQAIMLAMTFFIYYPFIRRYDNTLYEQEQKNLADEAAAAAGQE